MALSYSINSERIDAPYLMNKYNHYKFDDDNHLVTVENGSWILLNKKEFELLTSERFADDINLFNTLESKGVIITEKNIEKSTQMLRDRYHHLLNGVNLHIMVPTLRCNHSCVYCQSSSKPVAEKKYDMDEETAKKVVNFIMQTPSKSLVIEFQGGEPLLNFPIIQYVVDYVKKKNSSTTIGSDDWFNGKKKISFRIVSNFTLMDMDILDFIVENKIRISTSLDGPKKLHNKNRPYAGGNSYDKVVEWINIIHNELEYEYFRTVLPTITRYSLKYPKEIVDEYIQHNLNHIWMRPLNIAGTTISSWKKIGYTAEEFLKFWEEYIAYVISLNKKHFQIIDDTILAMLRRIITLKPLPNACLGSPCGACTIQAAYDQWGNIFTCDEARSFDIFKLGNVKNSSYHQIFTSSQALNFIGLTSMKASYCDVCAWSPFCSPCLVSTYGSQGNLIPKLKEDFLCKIRGQQVKYIFKKLLFSESDKSILMGWCSGKF
jgi:uncharacterized protein